MEDFGSAVLMTETTTVANSGTIVSTDVGIQGFDGASGATLTVFDTGDVTGDVAIGYDKYSLGLAVLDNVGTMTGTSASPSMLNVF